MIVVVVSKTFGTRISLRGKKEEEEKKKKERKKEKTKKK